MDIDYTDTIVDLPMELINTHIYGQVTNKQGNPIQEVTIGIKNQEVLTDENGYFSFEDIKADKNGTHIRATKNGYFQNTITVYPVLNHSLFSSIILNEKSSSATLLSWKGGSVKLGNEGWLDIDPNTLVYDSDGSNFEGTAYFETKVLPVNDPEFENSAPGEMIGLDDQQNRVGIAPVALLYLYVTDGQQHRLRLAKGQTATLSLTPSGSGISAFSESMPMWSFDGESNRWIRSGTGDFVNAENYIGEISNFNDWCFAAPYPITSVTGSLKYMGELDAAKHSIEVLDQVEMLTRTLYSDDQGVFSGYLPKDKELNMRVRNECGVVVYEENIGSFTAPSTLNLELSEGLDCRSVPVSGKLVNCQGDPVENAYVRISSKENISYYQTDASGFFSGTFKMCEDDLRVDISAGNYSDQAMVTAYSGLAVNENISIGDWVLCDVENGSISLQFRDLYFFMQEETGFELSSGAALFYGDSPDIYFDCFINYFQGEGVYQIKSETEADFLFSVVPNQPDAPKLFPDTTNFSSFKLVITKYIETERIEGTIEGMVKDVNHNDEQGMMYIKFSLPYVK